MINLSISSVNCFLFISTMSSAMATQQFAANVLRTGARSAGRTAPVRAARMTVRAAASNGGLPIDLRGEF